LATPAAQFLPAYDASEAQQNPPCAGAARARRYPHGRRLRARQRRGRSCDCPLQGRERPTWSPASPPPCWIRSPLSASPAGGQQADWVGCVSETDITGVTLPITKHNYLVTHANESGAHGSVRLLRGQVGASGPCWSTSLRTRSKARANSTGKRPAAIAGLRPIYRPLPRICAGARVNP